MNNSHTSGMVYIIESDPAMAQSVHWLLETHHRRVKTISVPKGFIEAEDYGKDDIILLDLNPSDPVIFMLFDQLLQTARRPKIIITSAIQAILRPDDIFSGDGVKVLPTPYMPQDILSAIDSLFMSLHGPDIRSST